MLQLYAEYMSHIFYIFSNYYYTDPTFFQLLHPNFTECMNASNCPVNSWNEWDPLEEIIVGIPDGATIPKYLTKDVEVCFLNNT